MSNNIEKMEIVVEKGYEELLATIITNKGIEVIDCLRLSGGAIGLTLIKHYYPEDLIAAAEDALYNLVITAKSLGLETEPSTSWTLQLPNNYEEQREPLKSMLHKLEVRLYKIKEDYQVTWEQLTHAMIIISARLLKDTQNVIDLDWAKTIVAKNLSYIINNSAIQKI